VILSDHWDTYVVPWNRVQQGGWGTEARFEPSRLVSLQFAADPKQLPVDFWVDDIEFVTAKPVAPAAASK
jgi:hypothetical protein